MSEVERTLVYIFGKHSFCMMATSLSTVIDLKIRKITHLMEKLSLAVRCKEYLEHITLRTDSLLLFVLFLWNY
jgi:hypothetical protein